MDPRSKYSSSTEFGFLLSKDPSDDGVDERDFERRAELQQMAPIPVVEA